MKIKRLLAAGMAAALLFTSVSPVSASADEYGVEDSGTVSDIEITEGEPVKVSLNGDVTDRWIKFTPKATGWYTFVSEGNYDTMAWLYSDKEGEAAEGITNKGDYYKFVPEKTDLVDMKSADAMSLQPGKTGAYIAYVETDYNDGISPYASISAYQYDTSITSISNINSNTSYDNDVYKRICEYNMEAGKTYLICSKVYRYEDYEFTYSMGTEPEERRKVTVDSPVTDEYTYQDNIIGFEPSDSGYYRMTPESSSENAYFNVKSNESIDYKASGTTENNGKYNYNTVFYAKKDSSYMMELSGIGSGKEYTLSVSKVPAIDYMSVKNLPVKTEYKLNDGTVDYSGLVVTVNYKDGTHEDVAYDSYIEKYGVKYEVKKPEYDNDVILKSGNRNIKVSLLGRSVEFSIQVSYDNMSGITNCSVGSYGR